MEISSYIKDLLLLNDCVIIPGFGGFVANYKPAQVKHNLLLPPSKEITFNPKLQMNDGLLITSISDRESISYFNAKLKVEAFVDEAYLHLGRYERITFEHVGELYFDQKENLLFEPVVTDMNLLADSYGLDSFSYEKLYEREMPHSGSKNQDRDAVQVVFSKRNVRKMMVGVPLVLALALIPMKNNKDIMVHSDMNIIAQLTEIVAPAPEVIDEPTITTTPEDISAAIPEPSSSVSTNTTTVTEATTPAVTKAVPATEVATTVATETDNKYFLIGGSFRDGNNAEIFMRQMSRDGYTPQNLGIFKGLHRISILSFSDYNEARKKLNSMRSSNPKMGVWLYTKE